MTTMRTKSEIENEIRKGLPTESRVLITKTELRKITGFGRDFANTVFLGLTSWNNSRQFLVSDVAERMYQLQISPNI